MILILKIEVFSLASQRGTAIVFLYLYYGDIFVHEINK